MDYAYYKDNISRPTSSKSEFISSTERCYEHFLNNNFIKKVRNDQLNLEDYHNLLINLFYQVYYSSSSFALAASRCSWEEKVMRDYLIKHAEEEKTHWCWILNDLKSTNCRIDPRTSHPGFKSSAYFSYAHFLANRNPILRLAMAYFLEGLSAKYGKSIGLDVCKKLGLQKEQASFFVLHGGLDEGHSEEVLDVLNNYNITDALWAEMVNVVECTTQMYANLYNI